MKRHQFSVRLLLGLAVLGLLAGCSAKPQSAGAAPSGIHRAPGSAAIDLTPTRGAIIAPPGVAAMGNAAPTRIVRIGLLLPLTGRNAELGKTMQDAATVALFDKYARLSTAQQQVRVELLPKDTGDSDQQAQAAMKAALDDGAELIIGPVFGTATEAAAPLAKARGISVLSFTNNNALASPGVYAFGFMPQDQAKRVIAYTLKQGKTRIAALVPDSPSGELILKAARDTLASTNRTLVAEAKYSPQGVGIDTALNKLIPEGGAPNFDALLLPEGGPALATILRALKARGVTPQTTQLIGTGFWDEPNLLRRVNLDGAWLASSPPQDTAQFEQRFLSTYKYVPTRISSLAYDAVALTVTLATSGRKFDAMTLTQSSGYSGPANGNFRLRNNGTVQRGLAVLRVEGANLTVIDPAPMGFTSTPTIQ